MLFCIFVSCAIISFVAKLWQLISEAVQLLRQFIMVKMALLSHHSDSLSIASVFAFNSGDEGDVFTFFWMV